MSPSEQVLSIDLRLTGLAVSDCVRARLYSASVVSLHNAEAYLSECLDAARELFNKEFNRLHDGHAAERVIDAFF